MSDGLNPSCEMIRYIALILRSFFLCVFTHPFISPRKKALTQAENCLIENNKNRGTRFARNSER